MTGHRKPETGDRTRTQDMGTRQSGNRKQDGEHMTIDGVLCWHNFVFLGPLLRIVCHPCVQVCDPNAEIKTNTISKEKVETVVLA